MQGLYDNRGGTQHGGYPYVSASLDRSNGAIRGEKKALLIGCNYKEHQHGTLDGCIDDAKKVGDLLITRFHYELHNIKLLVDDGVHEDTKPTRRNILKAMRWLVNGAKSGDSLFFQFAGHGEQTEDFSGDERDHKNQCLVPCDFRMSGCIVDDDINRILVRPIPNGCTLHALVDCCHSGTIMDLHHTILARDTGGWRWENGFVTKTYKGTSGGTVVQFSGCLDHQEGVESANQERAGLADHDKGGGLATLAFLKVFEMYPNQDVSYRQLLYNMTIQIKQRERDALNAQNCTNGMLRRQISRFRWRAPQRPMMSSNVIINIDDPVRL